MTSPIDFARDGAVGRITLSSPDTRNAIDQAFADALLDAVHRCEGDASIRSVLITGTGRFGKLEIERGGEVVGDIGLCDPAGDA